MLGPVALRDQAVATREAERLLAPFTGARVRIVFEGPKPIFRAPAFRCSDWFNRRNPVCAPGLGISRDSVLALRQPVLQAMLTLAKQDPSISVWDPFDVLCPTRTCSAVVNGKPLFFDSDHVTQYANYLLYPSFLKALQSVANPPDQTRPTVALSAQSNPQ